ncbi:MAG: hypothetical protein ACR2QE_16675 [Acidimicrobiales bacterium]
MSNGSGWQPLGKPSRPATVDNVHLTLSPFGRLARTHALGAAGDGAIALALAGSIFFNVSPTAARTSIALYLLLTIAPFAVVTPLIGPLIDRIKGGRRGMIIGTIIGRAVLAVCMAAYIDTWLLFPLAFALLVLQKAYAVAKSAMVPRLVASDDGLVEANSKLALLSALAGMSGVAVASIFGFIGGEATWAAGLAAVVYSVAAIQSFSVPKVVIAEAAPAAIELEEVRSATIRVSAVAMSLQRAVIGFVTFLLAFNIRGGDEGIDLVPEGAAVGVGGALALGRDVISDPPPPFWHFGVVALAAGAGALIGARLAPILRTKVKEEWMLLGTLVLTATAATAAAFTGGIGGAFLIALGVSSAVASGKLAFDSLVQRDAPDANYGRWFAKFEARFQLAWVFGAFFPVVINFKGDTGVRVAYVLVAGVAALAALVYFVVTRPRFQDRLRRLAPPPAADATPQPPADTTEALPTEGAAVADPTGVVAPLPAPTAALPAPPMAATGTELGGSDTTTSIEQPPDPTAPTWGQTAPPVVTSVEGVEVDEPES